MITNIGDFLTYVQQSLDMLGLTAIIQGALVVIGAVVVVKWILDHRSG